MFQPTKSFKPALYLYKVNSIPSNLSLFTCLKPRRHKISRSKWHQPLDHRAKGQSTLYVYSSDKTTSPSMDLEGEQHLTLSFFDMGFLFALLMFYSTIFGLWFIIPHLNIRTWWISGFPVFGPLATILEPHLTQGSNDVNEFSEGGDLDGENKPLLANQ